jgi:diadenosine tetraphosphatase ApaH/serine/threonine PP2A family protein phosphatase
MRYAVFADIHSNLQALTAVIDNCKKEAIDEYFCAGDMVGYGASPQECVDKIKSLCKVTVAGNHDWASVELFPEEYFNPYAKRAVSWTKSILNKSGGDFLRSLPLVHQNEFFTLTHASLDEPRDFNYVTDIESARPTLDLLENGVCFIGHTHIAGIFIQDKEGGIKYQHASRIPIKPANRYIINSGSVGQPRDHNPKASYAIYDTKNKTLDIKRVDYDIHAAREKIIASGLPAFLGDRLLEGV